ncbi:MAG: hypothetical protein M3365_06610 [Gemmatimonadota bacterium]|nr:hypothetical protein [Gemmatimonadota bacterium]
MKASVSLLSLFLIAAGCTDATTDPTGLTPPNSVAGAEAGNPPPPPVDAAVAVCTTGGCAAFEGAYMSNSTDDIAAAAVRALAKGEGVCTFPGHASLKIDDQLEPRLFDARTSANAAIKCNHLRASGGGTIEINGVVVRLENVIFFDNPPDCTARCGEFTALDENGNVATGVVFERDYYEEVCEDEGEGGGQCFPGGID